MYSFEYNIINDNRTYNNQLPTIGNSIPNDSSLINTIDNNSITMTEKMRSRQEICQNLDKM